MADEAENPEPSLENQEEQAPTSGGGRGLVIAFVALVVLMETAMFFFLVPSADEVSALAEAKLIKSVQDGEAAAEDQQNDENMNIEFNMGLFGEAFSPIDTERMYRVEIDLFVLIKKKDEETMKREFADKEGRLRHAIRMKIRNSALEELNDNNLGLLQRRILTTCNHLLEDDFLLGIGFKSYQLLEQ